LLSHKPSRITKVLRGSGSKLLSSISPEVLLSSLFIDRFTVDVAKILLTRARDNKYDNKVERTISRVRFSEDNAKTVRYTVFIFFLRFLLI